MEAAIMRVELRQDEDALIAVLSGDWQISGSVPRFDHFINSHGPIAGRTDETPRPRNVAALGFDATGLGKWDSSLLTFLLQSADYCEDRHIELREEGLPAEISRLLTLSRAVPERVERSGEDPSAFLARIGAGGIRLYDSVLESVEFVGEVGRSFVYLILRRVKMRWRDFWVVVQSNGWSALPIVTLIAFLVGLIISFLGAVVLQRFGAGYYVSYLVGYGMLREMGALMTGIIMAGRTGAAFAAELGSMKITEEIDAFRTLGVSPIDHLVLPRVLGLFAMMPLLTIYANFVGIMGGMLVAVAMLDIGVTQFIGGLLTPVTLADGLLGVFKGTVFGLIIGTAGCLRGLQTGNDAGSVGKAATSAVVTGITLIIVANAVIDWLAAVLNI
jgi:phospholipid/cholesterol/gamma-HCH transport system permease protein